MLVSLVVTFPLVVDVIPAPGLDLAFRFGGSLRPLKLRGVDACVDVLVVGCINCSIAYPAGAAEGYRDCALNMQSSKRDIRLLSESAFRTSVQVEQPGRGCLSVLGQL
jgi:hypothetical protein